ncbi:unannotated protein [freshwater metagenome]|uniref:Unannotated protein n=1 Tax=freshwater metagenome TaxID=449393 RepID=A0A6J6R170_9ZZZZ
MPGNRFGSAPTAIAPFSPALLGIQPNFAPVSLANFTIEDKPPSVSEILSPTKTTDLLVKPERAEIAETSFPDADLIKFAFSFSLPRLAYGAMLVTLIERLCTCL